ncbi:Uma2 family endonuclease [Aridibaculum aurantiacum]|uniref:Uma2 family endonuclease n=1 Tax=Aridibaculum aurantiacum TaxID=2810307 RepID=UPI001A964749|nr:Uma2 family endonuclease [Aridibaculum aurantiacum]
MGEAQKILPHYTYDDYVQWEGQWELIDGIPYAMSPAPVPKHQVIAVNLSTEFRLQLKKCKSCKVAQPLDYKVSDDTVIQPDMLVVCGEMKKKFLDFPPALVAEILSPSTALKDRHNKYPIYEEQGIPYFLIVSPDTEEVEVYQLVDKKYQLMQQGQAFEFEFIFEHSCSANIDFGEIWK